MRRSFTSLLVLCIGMLSAYQVQSKYSDKELLVNVSTCRYPKFNCDSNCQSELNEYDAANIHYDLNLFEATSSEQSESVAVWNFYKTNSEITTLVGLTELSTASKDFIEIYKIFMKLPVYSTDYASIIKPIYYLTTASFVGSLENEIYSNRAVLHGHTEKIKPTQGKGLIIFEKLGPTPLKGHVEGTSFYISQNQHFKVRKISDKIYSFIPVPDCHGGDLFLRRLKK